MAVECRSDSCAIDSGSDPLPKFVPNESRIFPFCQNEVFCFLDLCTRTVVAFNGLAKALAAEIAQALKPVIEYPYFRGMERE